MTKAKTLAICLTVLFAFAAVAASTASAEKLPAWGKCEAAAGHEGKYADSNCIEPVKKVDKGYRGGYEWHPQEENYSFLGGRIGATTFETTNGKKIECSSGTLGVAPEDLKAPDRVIEMLVSFTGCESEGAPCRSKGEAFGGISNLETWFDGEAIEGQLVYLSGKGTTSPAVGLTLTAEVAGQPLFTVLCEGELGSVEIGGAGGKKAEKAKGNTALGIVSPVDQMTTEFTQTFNQTGGLQEPATAETGAAKSLQMFESNESKWFQLGLASTFTYVSEEGRPPIEIKAVK